jgi:hypothetical protein
VEYEAAAPTHHSKLFVFCRFCKEGKGFNRKANNLLVISSGKKVVLRIQLLLGSQTTGYWGLEALTLTHGSQDCGGTALSSTLRCPKGPLSRKVRKQAMGRSLVFRSSRL